MWFVGYGLLLNSPTLHANDLLGGRLESNRGREVRKGRYQHELRRNRRVPVRFPAKIRTLDFGQVFYGDCVELSVEGMTLQTMYVPRPDEELDVYLMPPRMGKAPAKPLSARVKVMRCHALNDDHRYELGLFILEVYQ